MAWTQTDIDTLKAAIASRKGAQKITFSDRTVEFGSIDDMRKLLADMERDVTAAASTPRTRYAQTCKGV
jgi:predicted transcriptional regulator